MRVVYQPKAVDAVLLFAKQQTEEQQGDGKMEKIN